MRKLARLLLADDLSAHEEWEQAIDILLWFLARDAVKTEWVERRVEPSRRSNVFSHPLSQQSPHGCVFSLQGPGSGSRHLLQHSAGILELLEPIGKLAPPVHSNMIGKR